MNLLYTILAFIVLSCSHAPTKRTDKLSILQGLTNVKEVEFSIMADKGATLRYELRSAEGEILQPIETEVVTRPYSDWAIHKIIFDRNPVKTYNLYVYNGEKLVDQRLIGAGQKDPAKLKLAVASCSNDAFPEHFKIWDVLSQKNPEYLLLIGDNVYADQGFVGKSGVSVSPEHLWKRYTDTRLTLPLYFYEKLIPTHALWDDHDFGKNDGGEEFEHKEASREIFDAFYAQALAGENWGEGPGVGGQLTLGVFNLYFLDGRTFRSPTQEGRHLGNEQHLWLTAKLKDEVAPSFLIKGDQFFGGYHKFESFEGNHPEDFSSFVNELKLMNTPFIFLSGDRHLSEIMQFPRSLFGKPSFEITSSPIHSKLFPANQTQNPWRVVSEDAHMNFTIIDSVAKNDHWFLEVENIGENAETFYKRDLAVFIKDLQNNLNEAEKRRRSGKRRYIRKGKRSRSRRR